MSSSTESAALPALADVDADVRRGVRHLLFDIDDTVTWHGRLPEVAAQALYRAHDAGLQLIAVTGRSFAWAELLLRFFPLRACVAETGACALWRDEVGSGPVHVIHHVESLAHRCALNDRRDRAVARALAEVGAARLALDNGGRLYDTAFDLVEDGPAVDATDAARIRAILHEEGLVTAQSSVHINAWCLSDGALTVPAFDKATMVDRLLRGLYGQSLDEAAPRLCYVGDSQNDGPLFARAHLSVGVHNVVPHLEVLTARGQAPRYTVDGSGGFGFAQVVSALIDERNAS